MLPWFEMPGRARTVPAPEPAAAEMPARPLAPVPGLDELAPAMLATRTPDEVSRFLRHLCTLRHLAALPPRWRTAPLHEECVPYVEIAERVPTSTATVTRVAQWLRHGTGGYRTALDRTRASGATKEAS